MTKNPEPLWFDPEVFQAELRAAERAPEINVGPPEDDWLACGCETLTDHWFHVDIGLCD
jgi:hypothetical protein